jgi:hypothetical protein
MIRQAVSRTARRVVLYIPLLGCVGLLLGMLLTDNV